MPNKSANFDDATRAGSDFQLQRRLEECVKLAGSVETLADLAGIPRRSLDTYLKGKAELKVSRLVSIASAVGKSVEWLATGETSSEVRELGPEGDARFATIPVYDVEASAGHGHLVPHENIVDLLAFKREWIHQELHAQPGDLYLLFVSGDSMEPTLRPGDLILVDKRDAPIRADGIYVLVIEGALLVKRLQTLLGGKVRIVSDNSAYPAMEANRNQMNWGAQDGGGVDVVGRVVWAGRRF